MSQAKIIATIEKLLNLALSASTPKEEASTAYAKAKALMQKNNLTEESMTQQKIICVEAKNTLSKSTQLPKYMQAMLSEIERISETLGLILIKRSRSLNKTCPMIIFVGQNKKVQMALYLWTIISKNIKEERKKYLECLKECFKTEYKTTSVPQGFSQKMLKPVDAYTLGWIFGLTNRLTGNGQPEAETQECIKLVESTYKVKVPEKNKPTEKKPARRQEEDCEATSRMLGFHQGSKESILPPLNTTNPGL